MPIWDEDFERIVRAHLPYLEASAALTPDTSLTAVGLDSMGTIGLLMEIEDALGIEFPDEMLVPETFETPATLWGATRVAAKQPA